MSDDELTIYAPRNLGELKDFCRMITATNLVPTAYKGKPDDAMVAIMFGRETGGLGPLTSLQFVAVINGRPGFYSDAVPGIALNKGLILDLEESEEGEPFNDDYKRICIVSKPNGTVARQEFSVADAKQAGLWGKQGPWTQYPKRMLQWRARGYAVRDAAPHLLFGHTLEELQDIESSMAARDVTPKPPAPRGNRLQHFVEQHTPSPPAAEAPSDRQPAAGGEQTGAPVPRDARHPADQPQAHDPATGELPLEPAVAESKSEPRRGPTMVELSLPGRPPEQMAVGTAAQVLIAEAKDHSPGWIEVLISDNPWIKRHAYTRQALADLTANASDKS